MDAGSIQAGLPMNIPRADNKEGGPQIDLAKLAQPIVGVGNNLKAGEKVTISIDGDKVVISKEGPDVWDKLKTASNDTLRGAFRVARGMVEQDPSFAFREAMEVSRNSVSRVMPESLSSAINVGLYPVMRSVLTAIDIHKAIKTKREPTANLADKLVDYTHVATDVGGLIAIAGNLAPRLSIPGIGYFAAAAIVGDIIAGAWHAMRFASQGLSRLKMEEKDGTGQNQKPSGENPPDIKIEMKPYPKEVKTA